LLLYTDGLVEGRHLPLDDGLERLRSCVDTDLDCESLCDAIVARCSAGAAGRDDVALLAVRSLALDDDLHLSLPARPGTLQPLRAVIRRWLREGGASEEEVFDVVLATGEACANAICHAPTTDAAFELDGRRDADVWITVRNAGPWRERVDPDGAGRGLSIMNEFMDAVEITKGPPETVVTMRRTRHRRTTPPLPVRRLITTDASGPIPVAQASKDIGEDIDLADTTVDLTAQQSGQRT
jgi:anti-sigma regulatory factor (Ser/Thr protein kinase)